MRETLLPLAEWAEAEFGSGDARRTRRPVSLGVAAVAASPSAIAPSITLGDSLLPLPVVPAISR